MSIIEPFNTKDLRKERLPTSTLLSKYGTTLTSSVFLDSVSKIVGGYTMKKASSALIYHRKPYPSARTVIRKRTSTSTLNKLGQGVKSVLLK